VELRRRHDGDDRSDEDADSRGHGDHDEVEEIETASVSLIANLEWLSCELEALGVPGLEHLSRTQLME
jgi:hypothetical protein